MLRTTHLVFLFILACYTSLWGQTSKTDLLPESEPIATVAGEALSINAFNTYFAAIQTFLDAKNIPYYPGPLKVLLSEQMILDRMLSKSLLKEALKLSPEEQAHAREKFQSHYSIFPFEKVPKTEFGKFMDANILRQYAFIKEIRAQLPAVKKADLERYLARSQGYKQRSLPSSEIEKKLFQRRLLSQVKGAFNSLYTTYEVENHLKDRYVPNVEPSPIKNPTPTNLDSKRRTIGGRKPFSSLEILLQN